jgi:drug/metabolite transporter (DMT)-like permease
VGYVTAGIVTFGGNVDQEPQRQRKNSWAFREGPLQMMLASLILTVMLGLVKDVRLELSASETVFWRGVIAVPLAAWLARRVGFRVYNKRGMVLRCGFGVSAMWLYFVAAVGLSLADLTLLGKLRPMLIIVLAPILLGRSERTGRGLWLVIGVGLLGCALILQPGLAVGSRYGLIAVAGVLVSAAAHLTLRWLGRTEEPLIVVFWFQVAVVVVMGAVLLLVEGTIPLPPSHLWLQLTGIAVCATLGQVALTRAFKADRAGIVAAASYIGPVFAVIGDALFFAGWPTPQVWLGGGLVVCAGLFVAVKREPESGLEEPPRSVPHGM